MQNALFLWQEKSEKVGIENIRSEKSKPSQFQIYVDPFSKIETFIVQPFFQCMK